MDQWVKYGLGFLSIVCAFYFGVGLLGKAKVQKTPEHKDQLAEIHQTTSNSSIIEFGNVLRDTECARCHSSTKASKKPAALAFYDLDQGELWHQNLQVEDLAGFTKRLGQFSEEQQMILKAFVSAKEQELLKSDTK